MTRRRGRGPTGRARRRSPGRGRLILVLGGAASGKSRTALALGEQAGRRAFLATAEARDEEMAARIERHRAERGDRWEAVEVPAALAAWLREKGAGYDSIVVDCLTLWLSNLLAAGRDERELFEEVEALVTAARAAAARVIIVSNELGLGLVPADPASRRFRDVAGRVNQRVAAAADEVYLVVTGLRQRLK